MSISHDSWVEASRKAKAQHDLPLSVHAGSGYWVKKIRQRTHYIGPKHADWQTALRTWQETKDDLLAGRTPRPKGDQLTVAYVCNHFCAVKEARVKSKELTHRGFFDYVKTGRLVADALGRDRSLTDVRPDDFTRLRQKLAVRYGPETLFRQIIRVRAIFNHAYLSGLVDSPIRFGPNFTPPSKTVLRKHRTAKGRMDFSREEIHQLVDAATDVMKAMILLGVNVGVGNADIARLKFEHVDFASRWLDFPRVKTGVPRRAKLWPQTIKALKQAIEARPKPAHWRFKDYVFLTEKGYLWRSSEGERDYVGKQFLRLLRKTKLERGRVGFYSLRRTFATQAANCRDQQAVDHVMGHVDDSMAARYRQVIDDARLEEASRVVHRWLFPRKGGARR